MPDLSVVWMAAGAVGVALLSYCYYFDQKRINDPEHKQRLRQRRRMREISRIQQSDFPDPEDFDAREKYFLKEINDGETLIDNGNIEEGAEHLANAMVVCNRVADLLELLQKALPPEALNRVLEKLRQRKAYMIDKKMEAILSESANDSLDAQDLLKTINSANLTSLNILDDLE